MIVVWLRVAYDGDVIVVSKRAHEYNLTLRQPARCNVWRIWWWYDLTLESCDMVVVSNLVWPTWWWYGFSLKHQVTNRVGEGWAYYLFHCVRFPCNTFTSKINEQGEALCKCFWVLLFGGDLKYRWGKRQKRPGIDYLYILVHAHMYIIIHLLWWCDAFHDVTCTGGDMIVVSKGHNNTSSRCGSCRCGWCMCMCVCVCE